RAAWTLPSPGADQLLRGPQPATGRPSRPMRRSPPVEEERLVRSRFGFGLRPADSSRGRAASVRAWIVLGAAAALTLSALAAAGAAAAQPALARQDVGY